MSYPTKADERAHRDAFRAALMELACPGGSGHRYHDRSSDPAWRCKKCVASFLGRQRKKGPK